MDNLDNPLHLLFKSIEMKDDLKLEDIERILDENPELLHSNCLIRSEYPMNYYFILSEYNGIRTNILHQPFILERLDILRMLKKKNVNFDIEIFDKKIDQAELQSTPLELLLSYEASVSGWSNSHYSFTIENFRFLIENTKKKIFIPSNINNIRLEVVELLFQFSVNPENIEEQARNIIDQYKKGWIFLHDGVYELITDYIYNSGGSATKSAKK